jgi:hypothetical protein
VTRPTLVFVATASDAPPAASDVDVVVLDSAWTPLPGERADLLPIRPVLASVVEQVDLFGLRQLDAWATAGGLADRLVMEGVTWWPRLRMIVHWDLHERMLWRHVLDELLQRADYQTMVIPSDRRALVDAARASRDRTAPVVVIEATAPSATLPGRMTRLLATARPLPRRAARGVRRLARRVLRRPTPVSAKKLATQARAQELRARVATLDTRVEEIARRPGSVLAVASANFFQVLRDGGRDRFADPHLALVLDRLVAEETPVVTVALALDFHRDADWARIAADDRLIPDTYVRRRYLVDRDLAVDETDILGRLDDAPTVPLDVAGWDLGPAMSAIVSSEADRFLDGQRRWTMWAERLLRELRPSVMLVDHEGVRTVWLAAAKRVGIPVVAVQHGLIYPLNAEYTDPLHPGLVRPDLICVYGPYERDVLIEHGGYAAAQVTVTGSSRADPDTMSRPATPSERADVRRELGVRDGDTMVVISVAHNPIMGDVHSVCMVARLLGGPLPGVHLVFKLHPRGRDDDPYERLLSGMAAAGGYPVPTMTAVRDFDLYRLLRSTDAHLGQYSTVNTDAVVSGTPTLLAVGQAHADMLGYVAAKVAIPVRTVADVRRALEAIPPLDPDARSRFLDAHFERGDATGRIVSAMRTLSGGAINGGSDASR